jgi:hypothetical protein
LGATALAVTDLMLAGAQRVAVAQTGQVAACCWPWSSR